MTEWQLFEPGTVPECTTPEWYLDRERAPHWEDAAHRDRLDLAVRFVEAAVTNHGARDVVDLGCGDGGLLAALDPEIEAWGYDLCPANATAAVADRGVDVTYGDVLTGDILWADLAVCTEMLEHLLDPHEFVRRIARHSRFLVASSPYVETDESHYAFHTWAWDKEGYRELMRQAGFTVVRHETCSIFQVVLAVTQ